MTKVRNWGMAILMIVALLVPVPAGALSFYFPEVRVLYARGANWTSDLVIEGYGYPLGGQIVLTNCPVGPVPEAIWGGKGGAVIRNLGQYQCGTGSFGLIKMTAPGKIGTMLRFDDGHSRTSFYVPGLTYDLSQTNAVGRAGGIVNDGTESTYIVLVNVGASAAYYTATVYDTAGRVVGTESILALPGLTHYALLARLPTGGAVEVRPGTLGFGHPGSDARSETYGFATVGPNDGTTARVTPLEPNGAGLVTSPPPFYTVPQNTFYIVHPAQSLFEVSALLNDQSVMVRGSGEWPYLVIERVVGDLVFQQPPFVTSRYETHAGAGAAADMTINAGKFARVVTADDGAALLVVRMDGQ